MMVNMFYFILGALFGIVFLVLALMIIVVGKMEKEQKERMEETERKRLEAMKQEDDGK